MKVHTDLKELLEDFAMTHSAVINICGIAPDYEEFVKYYLSSNSLALGKPEPLAKNKQCEDNFICYLYESGRCSAKCHKPCGDIDCIAV